MATAKKAETKSAAKTEAPEATKAVGQPPEPELAVQAETYTDKKGIERLGAPVDKSWEPAPTKPDPHQVERAEARAKAEKEAQSNG